MVANDQTDQFPIGRRPSGRRRQRADAGTSGLFPRGTARWDADAVELRCGAKNTACLRATGTGRRDEHIEESQREARDTTCAVSTRVGRAKRGVQSG